MKAYGGVEVQPREFLILALDECEWLAPRSSRFTQGEATPCAHWIGAWLYPRDNLDATALLGI
jgi:hypothetical protein